MVPKPTASHNHNHTLGFPGLGPPLLLLCAGRNSSFSIHLTDPEGSSPSGHTAPTIIFQYQILFKIPSRHSSCGCVLWVVFYSGRDPPSALASTELRLTQHQPLLSPSGTSTLPAGTQSLCHKFQFLPGKPRDSVSTPPPLQCDHKLSSPLQLVLRGKPQINPKELEELTVPHLENKFSS